MRDFWYKVTILSAILWMPATGSRDKLLSSVTTSSIWSSLPLSIPSSATDGAFDTETQPWVEQVAESPRVYLFHNFLSKEEATHIIKSAAPIMRRSRVIKGTGTGEVAGRNSYGAFLRRQQDPIIGRVQKRIELWSHYPMEHQEDMQVLRYAPGQSYQAHYDSIYDADSQAQHVRMATFLLYLNDVEEGGETAFPEGKWSAPQPQAKGTGPSPCAQGVLHTKAKAGDAVLFFSYFPNRTMDPASKHVGCEVTKGYKWAAPVWIHMAEFRPEELKRPLNAVDLPHDPGMCIDWHADCAKWTELGGCQQNKEFMVGGDFSSGNCRRTCNVCKPCKQGDWDCFNNNREAAGFLKLDKAELAQLGLADFFQAHVTQATTTATAKKAA